MLLVFFKLYIFRKVIYYSVNTNANKAAFPYLLKFFYKFALFSAGYRGKKLKFCTLVIGHYLIDYHINRLGLDFAAADGTVRNAYPCIKQPEVIVNLGDGSDC